MNRGYFQLIDSCNEAVRLSTAIARNADYQAYIEKATDPFVQECCNDAEALLRKFRELIGIQMKAHDNQRRP